GLPGDVVAMARRRIVEVGHPLLGREAVLLALAVLVELRAIDVADDRQPPAVHEGAIVDDDRARAVVREAGLGILDVEGEREVLSGLERLLDLEAAPPELRPRCR